MLGAYPQVYDTCLQACYKSGHVRDLRPMPALSCLQCLLSGELERCTDLQVVPTALEIAVRLPAAATSTSQTMNQDSKTWWFVAFVHLCGRGRKPGMSGSTMGFVTKLKWRDLRFARLALVREPA